MLTNAEGMKVVAGGSIQMSVIVCMERGRRLEEAYQCH